MLLTSWWLRIKKIPPEDPFEDLSTVYICKKYRTTYQRIVPVFANFRSKFSVVQ